MNRFAIVAATALVVALASDPPEASAQPQVPGGGAGSRPTFSPYLNLLGGGRSPGLNYLGIVRPQQQLNQQFGQLQQQLNVQNQSINEAIQDSQDPLVAPTGNVSVFNSTGGYFNRIPGITTGGGFGGSTGGFNRQLGGGIGGGMGGGIGNSGFSRPQSSRGGRR